MCEMMEKESRRWTARRYSALALEIIQGKTAVAAASRQFDLTRAGIEKRVEGGKRGMEIPEGPSLSRCARSASDC